MTRFLRPDVALATLANLRASTLGGVTLVPVNAQGLQAPSLAPLPVRVGNAPWYLPDWKWLRIAIKFRSGTLTTDQLAQIQVLFFEDIIGPAGNAQVAVTRSIQWKWTAGTGFSDIVYDMPIATPWLNIIINMPFYAGDAGNPGFCDVTLSAHNGTRHARDAAVGAFIIGTGPENLFTPVNGTVLGAGVPGPNTDLRFYEGWAWLHFVATVTGYCTLLAVAQTGPTPDGYFLQIGSATGPTQFNGPVYIPPKWNQLQYGNSGGGGPSTFYISLRPIERGYEP